MALQLIILYCNILYSDVMFVVPFGVLFCTVLRNTLALLNILCARTLYTVYYLTATCTQYLQ